MSRRVTASRAALFLSPCQWWATPEAVWDESTGMAAREGSATHEFNPALRLPPNTDVVHKYDLDEAAWQRVHARTAHMRKLPDIVRGTIGGEAAYAFDPRTGTARVLALGAHDRSVYEQAKPHELCGTADIIWRDGDTVGTLDIKTGQEGSLAAHRPQLELLAMFGWLVAKDAARAVHGVWHVTETGASLETENLNDYDLEVMRDAWLTELNTFDVAQSKGSLKPVPGSHCSKLWCPARASCPAGVAAAQAIVPAERLLPAHRLSGAIASREEAQYRLALLPLLKERVKAYEAELRAFADEHGGIETAEGLWQKVSRETVQLIANADALDLLDRELGEAAKEALSIEISAASIKRAVKAAGLKPQGETADRIVAAIKALGACETTTRTTYEGAK